MPIRAVNRFTIRRMLILIALLAVALGVGRWVYWRYLRQGVVHTYYVGDLAEIPPAATRPGVISPQALATLNGEADLLKSSITPDVWWLGTRSVSPFPTSAALVVRHTEAGHAQVAEWLRRRRDLFYKARNSSSVAP
ncbi:hypothetical protein [Paludisphaera rhizosphaerae]|uniref:hypothetical protein n=1 Tax=Paludisphaera rhizosphaerae TaxID=2711216 RepID=UPI0013EB1B0E|nr:hypothetical protein [Paludisphaera rhizosphaerae]